MIPISKRYTDLATYDTFLDEVLKVDKTTVTAKGQIVIPAALRQKMNIRQGTQIHIFERNGEIILRPVTDEYIQSCVGMTGTRGKLLKALLQEKKKERERESRRKGARLV